MANKEPKMGEIVYLGQRRRQKLRQQAKQQKQQRKHAKRRQAVVWQTRLVRWLYGGLVVGLVLAVMLLRNPIPTPEIQASGPQAVTEGQSASQQGAPDQQGADRLDPTADSLQAPNQQAADTALATPPQAQAPSNQTGDTGSGAASDPDTAVAGSALQDQQQEAQPVVQTSKQPLQQPGEGSWSRLYGYGYDDTWQDYRFHQGVDMELPQGSEVSAIGAGTVLAIRQDPIQGTLLELDLGGGMVATYGGVSPRQDLAPGQAVAAGEVIGTVAASPVEEASQPPHIHLEIRVDGASSDPLTLLPEE